jgi:3-oxoacyl-[acyl-carrier protein] reductase
MVERIRDDLGAVDILVNNAGIMLKGTLLDHREDDFDSMWRTNVKGVLYCAAAVAPGMIERGWGRIINVSSNAGVGTAFPGTTFYASTKAAVLILTRRLAFELGPHGITVNAVLPGFIRTDMTMADLSPEGVAGVTDALNQRSVLGRGVGEPEEIAHLIEFLGSERSSFMTGQHLLADGGRIDYLSHV